MEQAVESVSQKGTNLGHDRTGPCKANTAGSLGTQALGLGIQKSGKHWSSLTASSSDGDKEALRGDGTSAK